VVLPSSLLEKSITVVDATVKPPPDQSGLVTTFVTRMDAVKSLDANRKSDLKAQAVRAVKEQVYPAYERMRAALIALRPAAATQSAGVSRLPDGAAYYQLTLQQMTTSDYTADQIHQLGLSEVARITKEMQTLLDAQGIKGDTIAARMQQLHEDPKYHLPNTPEGRAQLLDRYRQILTEVYARMPEYFRLMPKAIPIVQRLPEALEAGAAAAQYQGGALDGSRPGIFEVNEHGLSRGCSGAPFPNIHRANAQGPAPPSPGAHLHSLRGRLGALCGTFCSRNRHVQGRSAR
jgi:uncharacterized protein (DUF885 family)